MWIKCNDWLPKEGIDVEVFCFGGFRYIASVKQEYVDHLETNIMVWRDSTYGNQILPKWWTLLREGPRDEE